MIEFTDAFGRKTIIETLPTVYNRTVGLVVRRERVSTYESFDLRTARELVKELEASIKLVEENNDKEI